MGGKGGGSSRPSGGGYDYWGADAPERYRSQSGSPQANMAGTGAGNGGNGGDYGGDYGGASEQSSSPSGYNSEVERSLDLGMGMPNVKETMGAVTGPMGLAAAIASNISRHSSINTNIAETKSKEYGPGYQGMVEPGTGRVSSLMDDDDDDDDSLGGGGVGSSSGGAGGGSGAAGTSSDGTASEGFGGY